MRWNISFSYIFNISIIFLFFGHLHWWKWIWLFYCFSIRQFVRNARSQNWCISFFWFFCVILERHKVIKVTSRFLKKGLGSLGGPKRSLNGLKMRFWGFCQKSNPFICTFLTSVRNWQRSFNILLKPHVREKSGSWVMVKNRLDQ